MQYRRSTISTYSIVSLLTWALALTGATAGAQQATVSGTVGSKDLGTSLQPTAEATATSTNGGPVFKAESRMVLVDTVVTDKKGNYLRDLAAKDFRVWEDNKEQRITSFSMGDDPASPEYSQRRYLVLFFDNSTRNFRDQAVVRKIAATFIDSNVGPNRQVAVVDFGSSLRVAQNFTSDTDRLKKAVADLRRSSVSPNAGPSQSPIQSPVSPPNAGPEDAQFREFTTRNLTQALGALTRSLSTISGRKTLVLFTQSFRIGPDMRSDVMSAIDACNKANVAIYPVDIRGLQAPGAQPDSSSLSFPANRQSVHVTSATYHYAGEGTLRYPRLQLVAREGIRANHTDDDSSFSLNQYDNQEALYWLASATSGFVVLNTNDLLGGLEKIGKEQSEYYVLGYSPSQSPEGSCHTLKVKVDRGGTIVRSRNGYCNVRPRDLLAGSTVERRMESQASAGMEGNITGSMEAPFFYTSPNTARVNLALEIPSGSLKFEKVKGKMHSAVNILGIAYKTDNTIAARFSDTVNLDFADANEVQKFTAAPFHYENQFEIAPGNYLLKVVFSSGNESFGKLEKQIAIDAYNGKQFMLSGLVLSDQIQRVAEGEDAALLGDKTPLVAHGIQITPSASNCFKQTESAAIYAEVYEPLLTEPSPPHVGIKVTVVDRKSGAKKLEIPVPNTDSSIEKGSSVIRLGLQLPMSSLTPGSYQLQLRAADSSGHSAPPRSADFEVE